MRKTRAQLLPINQLAKLLLFIKTCNYTLTHEVTGCYEQSIVYMTPIRVTFFSFFPVSAFSVSIKFQIASYCVRAPRKSDNSVKYDRYEVQLCRINE